MSAKPLGLVFALALLFPFTGGGVARAQERAKPKDDALESLLKELNESDKPAAKPANPAKAADNRSRAPPKRRNRLHVPVRRPTRRRRHPPTSPASRPPPNREMRVRFRPRIRHLTSFLEKLGETKDEPTPEDRPRRGGPGGEPPPTAAREKSSADKLGGKDKDLDERLEELTGRKKKRPASDQERDRTSRRDDQGDERRRTAAGQARSQ